MSVKPKKKPLMSMWFKKWLLLIGGLFLLFLVPASFFKFDEGLVMAWLLFFLLCLMIFGVVVIITAIISYIKKIIQLKKDWSLSDHVSIIVNRYFPKAYEAWLMSDFYRKHLTIKYGDGRVRLQMIQHYDLVHAKYKRIFKYKAKHSYKEFVYFSLRQAINGCNHIIFLVNEEDDRFVQFWTRRNILYMDFPMFHTTSLAFYGEQVMELLKGYGFKKTKDALTPSDEEITKDGRYYSVNLESRGQSINANFFTNIELATEITIKILNGILDVKQDNVDILMG